jgi:hypothetical protein
MAELAVLRVGELDAHDLCGRGKPCEFQQAAAVHRHGGLSPDNTQGNELKRPAAKENTGKRVAGVKFP